MGGDGVAGNALLGATRVGIAFFLSGAAALIYQVVWQRLLFVVLGVDIESVTIVVSTFMLGLGLGAAFGGVLADRFPGRILLAFCLLEAGIALFGIFSVDIILATDGLAAGLGRGAAAALSFGLLVFPTLLMGATLPMLVAYSFRSSRNIGVSTGTLYALNTLGAALGALAVGFFLLYWLDLRQSARVAAFLNGTAAATIAGAFLRR
jgi:predicted membrane-bound spermidine synthase